MLLYILYAACLSVAVTRSAFLSNSGIPRKTLVIIFLLYAFAGGAHIFIAWNYFPGHGDIWEMFRLSLSLKQQLLHDYPAFKKEFFPDQFYIELAGPHAGWSSYEHQWLTALHIVLNFLSFDNIYINTLLFCFLTMFGKVAFYRMLVERYPSASAVALLLVFFIPGVVFWTAVIHKEGLLYSCLGVLVYCLQKIFAGQQTYKRWAIALLMLLVIFITRKVLVLTLLPALAVWWLWQKTTFNRKFIVPAVLAGGVLGLALLASLHPSWNVLGLLTARQHDFMLLKGGSLMYVPPLDDHWSSFVNAFPYAVRNGLFMPLPGMAGSNIYLLFFAETLLLWGLIIHGVTKRRLALDGFTIGFLLFAVFGMLVVGYIVPFSGAVVRYRSIFYPFLLAPFVLGTTKTKMAQT